MTDEPSEVLRQGIFDRGAVSGIFVLAHLVGGGIPDFDLQRFRSIQKRGMGGFGGLPDSDTAIIRAEMTRTLCPGLFS